MLKTRLKDGGILQQWFPWMPGSEETVVMAVAKSLRDVFPHVRVFVSVAGWGFHFLASAEPFSMPGPDEFVDRLPKLARVDLVEWSDPKEPRTAAQGILSREVPLSILVDQSGGFAVTDDQPYNEYFLLRRLWLWLTR